LKSFLPDKGGEGKVWEKREEKGRRWKGKGMKRKGGEEDF